MLSSRREVPGSGSHCCSYPQYAQRDLGFLPFCTVGGSQKVVQGFPGALWFRMQGRGSGQCWERAGQLPSWMAGQVECGVEAGGSPSSAVHQQDDLGSANCAFLALVRYFRCFEATLTGEG